MAQLYQWTVPCTICESPVGYHCNTCGDVFCENCRGIHLKSKASRHHVIVPYSERVEPNESLQCGDHSGHQCGVWCQTCNKAVCSECVISPNHRGHIFLKFDEKIGEKRKEIQNQFDRCSTLLSDWQNSLVEAKKLEQAYQKDVANLHKEIVVQADELCKEVRKVEKESRRQLQEMTDASLAVLHAQQTTLTNGILTMNKKIKELEDTLRSNDSSLILQYSADTMAEGKPPTDNPPAVPAFIPGSLHTEVLKNLLGYLSVSSNPSAKSKSVQHVESQQAMPLLGKPIMESVISTEYADYGSAVVCVGNGQAWIKRASKRVQLVDREGTVQKTANIDFDIYDMTLATNGKILLSDIDNKCIRSMSMDGDIKTLFSTQWRPYGICYLPNGDIVVSFKYDKRVVQYSSSGKVIKEMDRSLFKYTWYVAYSQVNRQLYVCDKSTSYSFAATGRVLFLDMNGRLQYTYTGSDKSTFTPLGLSTDQAGRVLITDFSNDSVHILDKGGNFLQYLLTGGKGLTRPVTIDIDSDGFAWIGECNTNKMKVVKYTG